LGAIVRRDNHVKVIISEGKVGLGTANMREVQPG